MSINFPNADFTPQLAGYTGQGAFRFWCQKVLPIVYDDSLSYYELLNKVVNYLNNVIADVASVEENIGRLNDSYVDLQNYVNEHMQELVEVVNTFTSFVENYFDNLDVQEEINNKLNHMASDGSLTVLIAPIVRTVAPDIITEWMEANITPTTPAIDKSLRVTDAGADALVVGDYIRSLNDIAYGQANSVVWSIGTINESGVDAVDSTRVRTAVFECYNKNLFLMNNGTPNSYIAIFYYDEENTYEGTSGWIHVNSMVEIVSSNPQKKYARLVYRYSPSKEMTSADLDYVGNFIRVCQINGTVREYNVINEQTLNLWKDGDIFCENGPVYIDNVNIPAGEYILHADIERQSASRCRVVFYRGRFEGQMADPWLAPAEAPPYTKISLPYDCTFVAFYAGLASTSVTPTRWRNIQIFSGNTILPNTPNLTMVDYVARAYSEGLAKSNNLWAFGDLNFTATFDTGTYNMPISIEAGEYVVSAFIVSRKTVDDTEIEGSNWNARLVFYDYDNQAVCDTSLSRNIHASTKITLSGNCTRIVFYASNTSGNSAGTRCTWSNIQIVSGNLNQGYQAYYDTAHHIEECVKPKNDIFFEEKNVVLRSGSWNFNIVKDRVDTRNIIVSILAHYDGVPSNEYNLPRFSVYYTTGDQGTTWYYLCGQQAHEVKKFRMPPAPNYIGAYANTMYMRIFIPSGMTVTIDRITFEYSDEINRSDNGVKIAAHGNFMYYPQHSILSVLSAANCGAEKCIVIPKVTSDGVWFAYHDDTFNINTTHLRNSDGSVIATSPYNGEYFNDIPWSYLEQFDSGISKNIAFAGLKLMKISDYFSVCGKTGMKPYFSLHPVTRMGSSVMENLKELASNYGVLRQLSLKPANFEYLYTVIFPVFGNDIEEYCLLNHLGGNVDNDITEMIDSFNRCIAGGLDVNRVRCTIELWQPDITESRVSRIKEAGLNVSCVSEVHVTAEGITNYYYITEGDYKYLQSIGVSEFTENHNPSFGLNW